MEDKHAPGCPKSGLFAAPFIARRRPSDFTGGKYQSGATEKDEGEKSWVSPVGFRYWHENRERCNRKGQQIHPFGLLFGCLDQDGAIRMPTLTTVWYSRKSERLQLSLVDTGAQDTAAHLKLTGDRLSREISNLLDLAASGISADTLAPKIRERQTALAKVAAHLRVPRPAPPNLTQLRAALEQRAAEWKADLRAEPKVARAAAAAARRADHADRPGRCVSLLAMGGVGGRLRCWTGSSNWVRPQKEPLDVTPCPSTKSLSPLISRSYAFRMICYLIAASAFSCCSSQK